MAGRKGVCHFGQRIVRGGLPLRSPLRDIRPVAHIGDAILENFSYVILKKGSTVPAPVPLYSLPYFLLKQRELERIRSRAQELAGGEGETTTPTSSAAIDKKEEKKKKMTKAEKKKAEEEAATPVESKQTRSISSLPPLPINASLQGDLADESQSLFTKRWSRILLPPLKRTKHVVLDLCTPDGSLERRYIIRTIFPRPFFFHS
jgi:hypothetical protein